MSDKRLCRGLLPRVAVHAVLAGLLSAAGNGQSASPTERELTGPDTIDNPCEARGFLVGGVRICPAAALFYQWNEEGEENNEGGLVVNPSLRARLMRPALSLTAGLASKLVVDPGDWQLNDANADADVSLRATLGPRTSVEFDAAYDFLRDRPSRRLARLIGAENTHDAEISFGIAHRLGDFTFKADAAAAIAVFEDVELRQGGVIDNSRRDHVEPELALRVTHEASGAMRPFLEAAYVPRFFLAGRDRSGRHRDAHGLELIAGVALAGRGAWRGEAGLIYARQFYEDSEVGDVAALGLNLDLTWTPLTRTEIVFSAATTIEQATAGAIGGVPTYAALLQASRTIGEDVRITVSAYGEFQDFPGRGGDLTIIPKLTFAVALSERLTWTSSYELTWFDSQFDGAGDTEHLLKSGFELRL